MGTAMRIELGGKDPLRGVLSYRVEARSPTLGHSRKPVLQGKTNLPGTSTIEYRLRVSMAALSPLKFFLLDLCSSVVV